MFDWLKTDHTVSNILNFKGTAYCATIQESWFPNILAGELGELDPWLTPKGLVYPVFALDEIITAKEQTLMQQAQREKRIMCGLRLNKLILDRIKSEQINILQDFPPNYAVQTVFIMTPKTLGKIFLTFGCLSDGKRLIGSSPLGDRKLVLPYDSMKDNQLFKQMKEAKLKNERTLESLPPLREDAQEGV